MTNYKESIVSGSQYQRAYRVIIDNILGQVPQASFQEELVTSLDSGEVITRHVGSVSLDFDPTFVVPLINPITNEPLLDENNIQKTATLEEMYVIFYSLYWEAARLRDEATQSNEPEV